MSEKLSTNLHSNLLKMGAGSSNCLPFTACLLLSQTATLKISFCTQSFLTIFLTFSDHQSMWINQLQGSNHTVIILNCDILIQSIPLLRSKILIPAWDPVYSAAVQILDPYPAWPVDRFTSIGRWTALANRWKLPHYQQDLLFSTRK